jgi:predicted ArsR family transcriptional regulator
MGVPDGADMTLSGGAVVSSTLREEVSARIRRALLVGDLRPGQRIKEVRLAEALGVSRPTVRESLQQLIHEESAHPAAVQGHSRPAAHARGTARRGRGTDVLGGDGRAPAVT